MIRGIHAILYAFFDENERLDREAMHRQVHLCREAGVAGVAALGLATEVAKLSFDERCLLMQWVAEDVAGSLPLGFTISGNSVAEQVSMIRQAEHVGANWVILQPPAAGKYEGAEYVSFFSRVMAATALPVAIQNAQQYLGRGISNDEIQHLRSRHPNFQLIKSESSAADVAELISQAGPDFKVFNGRGGIELIECLDAGCHGFLLAPDLVDFSVTVMKLCEAGKREEAQALYSDVRPAISFIMQSIEHLICYGKRLFAQRAGLAVHDRAPALRSTVEGLQEIDRLVNILGSFPQAGRPKAASRSLSA